jgi:hypothetical protein
VPSHSFTVTAMSNRVSCARGSNLRWVGTCCLAALMFAFRAETVHAQAGSVTGRVTNALTGAPVIAARVTVAGTAIATTVDEDGRFRLTNVPVSARELLARGLGYKPAAAAFALTRRVRYGRCRRHAPACNRQFGDGGECE